MPFEPPHSDSPLDDLIEVVDRLLGPGGCPWDQEQTHESLKKYLLEEAYEVIEAIDAGNNDELKTELGDLLLQPLMHSQMEKRDGGWDIQDVARGIRDKLIHRHPHVFSDVAVADSAEVLKNWDRLKKQEKGAPASILDGIPRAMPALLRAHAISVRAARAGFEWPDMESVFDKLHEEEAELREALDSGDQDRIADELGDLLFTAVNIARWAKVDPEDALRRMLDRFTSRFQAMEAESEKPLDSLNSEEWDALWTTAKVRKNC